MIRNEITISTRKGYSPVCLYNLRVAQAMINADLQTTKYDGRALEIRCLPREMDSMIRCYYILESLKTLSTQSNNDHHMVILSGKVVENPSTNYQRAEATLLMVGYCSWKNRYYAYKANISRVGKNPKKLIERISEIESDNVTIVAQFVRENAQIFDELTFLQVHTGDRERIQNSALKAQCQLMKAVIFQRSTKDPVIPGSCQSIKDITAKWNRTRHGAVLRPTLNARQRIS